MYSATAHVPPNDGASRSSLACLTCRSRHVKCDGNRPHCHRCVGAAKQCQYAPSRRGGLDRAALAERRKRLAASESVASVDRPTSQPSTAARSSQEPTTQFVEGDNFNGFSYLNGTDLGDGNSALVTSEESQDQFNNIERDPLIASYYKNFHKLHPLLLPRVHLVRLYQNQSRQLSFNPLIAVLRLIGNIYASQEWSVALKDDVEMCLSQAPQTDPVMVQCRLIYSMALFWNCYMTQSKQQMDIAVRLAIDLQMFRQDFATTHGGEDPVLTECWRRTWWMLYIVEAYYAGTLGTMNFAVVDIEAAVDLPCEESEYESGEIPEPKTLEDFNCREFASEDVSFSSFAYLIGAVKCAALAISMAPKVAAREDSVHVIQSADSIIEAWSLLLPKGRKQVMNDTGDIDELMFQAHLVVHVATIGLHRPLSDLRFNPVEDVSSCAREPPLDNPKTELVNVHTVRVLRSVEAQIYLLALPIRPFHHSPFITCMVSEGTLALLSACHFLLKGKKLTIARDQIRMTIGCLKALGEIWPRTARNVQEIQAIARHVLGLESKVPNNSRTTAFSSLPSLSGGGATESLGTAPEISSSETDAFASLSSMDNVCGWYNIDDLGPQLAEWMGNGP